MKGLLYESQRIDYFLIKVTPSHIFIATVVLVVVVVAVVYGGNALCHKNLINSSYGFLLNLVIKRNRATDRRSLTSTLLILGR